MVCCNVLQRVAACCSVLPRTGLSAHCMFAEDSSALQCVAVCSGVLQCVAEDSFKHNLHFASSCHTLWPCPPPPSPLSHHRLRPRQKIWLRNWTSVEKWKTVSSSSSRAKFVAAFYSVLQCFAVSSSSSWVEWSMVAAWAECCSMHRSVFQRVALCCTVLHCAVVWCSMHCSVLQRAAVCCSVL